MEKKLLQFSLKVKCLDGYRRAREKQQPETRIADIILLRCLLDIILRFVIELKQNGNSL